MGTQTLITSAQFGQLSLEEREDYELVDGELVPMASATFGHSIIKDAIITALRIYLRANPGVGEVGSEVDCELLETIVRRPDVAFFAHKPDRTVPRKQVPVPFAPDIAVEVLSPSESAMDLNRKVRQYKNAGCQEIWVVDQDNAEVFVYHSNGGVQLLRSSSQLTSPLLPGFELSIAELLAQ